MANIAEKLREEIDQSLQSGVDLTVASNRTTFLKEFMEKYKKDFPDMKISSLRPSFNRELDKKVPREKSKIPTRKPKFNEKMASEISSKSTQEKPSGLKDEKKDKDSKTGEQGTTGKVAPKTGPDGKPLPQTDTGVPPVKYDHWTTRGIGALFQSFLLPLKAVWPEMPSLTDEEKEALGEMWLPGFQRYGDEKLQFLVFPALGTMGILVPKMAQGRKLHKEAEDKKEQKKKTEKATKEEEERVNKLSCRFCNELFDSAHIKQHEATCPKRVG